MSSENVYLFIPNIIGYSRIILGIISLFLLPSDPLYAMFLYGLSCILDAVDGHAARLFNQSSRFGAVLDMVTDRCSTACLLVFLGHFYPSYLIITQILISLDLASHYAHMVSSLTLGSSSHKKVSEKTPFLLRLYYQNSIVLFGVCAGNEIFFMMCYLLGWPKVMHSSIGSLVWTLWLISLPICVIKQLLNIVQLIGASKDLVTADMNSRRKGKDRLK